MKRGLRSRLAQYGDEEFAFFLRRGFLKGAGYTDDALDRPIVGVLSTASDFNPCHRARRAARRRSAVRVSHHLVARGVLLPDLDAAAKPDVDGCRGDAQGAPA